MHYVTSLKIENTPANAWQGYNYLTLLKDIYATSLPTEGLTFSKGRSPDSRVTLLQPSQLYTSGLDSSTSTVAGAVMDFHHFPFLNFYKYLR